MSQVKLVCGDALEVLKSMPDASVDSVVTDPPAGIEFMGARFDTPDAYDTDGDTDREKFVAYLTPILRECLRVLKPGGHAFVWALPRTSHWTGWAVESAGFVVKDCFTHIFGSGFPKSVDLSKAIDQAAGMDRTITGYDASRARPNRHYEAGALGNIGGSGTVSDRTDNGATLTAAASEAARRHDGSGSAVKPSSEHWWLCMRPLAPVTATQIRAATGWDWWYTARDRPANTPAERLKWKKRGIVVPPPWREGTLIVSKRRALHAGVRGGVFLEWAPVRQDRDRPEGAVLLGVTDARAWREWSSSTIAANVLVHGTGGLQIDRCRVPFASDADFASAAPGGEATGKPGALAGGTQHDGARTGFRPKIDRRALSNHARSAKAAESKGIYGDSAEQETHQTAGQKLGRYPANLLLSHSPGCRRVGTAPGTRKGHWPAARGTGSARCGPSGHAGQEDLEERSAVGEAVAVWECEPGCAVETLDGQSGVLTTHSGKTVGTSAGAASIYGTFMSGGYDNRPGDAGGASRFFSAFACEPGCPVAALDVQSGYLTSGTGAVRHASGSDAESNTGAAYGKESRPAGTPMLCYGDAGGASRFFTQLEVPFLYQSKPSRSERERGCDHLRGRKEDGVGVRNHHPTVKSVALMRHLCLLTCPPGGTVLDPFCGSGTTGIAAVQEGFDFIGIEKEPPYHAIAEARINYARAAASKPDALSAPVRPPESSPVPAEEMTSPAEAPGAGGASSPLDIFLARLRSA